MHIGTAHSHCNQNIALLPLLYSFQLHEIQFQNLPATSYYKLIDWWLLFCFIVLVVILQFHTYLAYLISKAKTEPKIEKNVTQVQPFDADKNEDHLVTRKSFKQAAWLNKVGKMIFIIVLILFNLLFWTVALIEHFKATEEMISSQI